jgi:pimeloyl-ACP methyl ester carboxylesterase
MSQPVLVLALAAATLAALAALVAASIRIAAAVARARLRRAHSAPGRLVPAAGTTLHVVRTGPDRGPTVVLVAGVGGLGAGWAGIQERLGPSVATLAYDRAGLGWSGPARGPRTAETLADELDQLLAASGAAAPYVVVGHSLGGIVARHLAARHPGTIAGVVLVDSAHEEQYERLPEVASVVRRMTGVPGALVRLMGDLAALRAGRAPLDARLPAAAAASVRAGTAVGAGHLPTAMAEMRAVARGTRPVETLDDMPLIVLRHGRYERMPMLRPDVNDRFEALFTDLQAELAALSSRGRVVVAEGAGHDIHLDRPDLVVTAILDVLAEGAPAGTTPGPLTAGRSPADAGSEPGERGGAPAPTAAPPRGDRRAGAAGALLAAATRPALVLAGALLAGGAMLAAAGVAAGWVLYLGGYASAAVAFPALAAAHGDRIGRGGRAAFALATLAVVLGTPVVAMVATFVLRLDALHHALMPYAMSPVGMLGAFGVNLAVVVVGIVVARARVVPATAGWLLVAAAVVEVPVEIGALPLAAWALAMTLVAVAFWLAARALGSADRPVAGPVTALSAR